MVYEFMKNEGILVGILFGVVVVVVKCFVEKFENVGKNIVVILLSVIECYLFSLLFVEEFSEKELV